MSITVGVNETSKFRMEMLNDLKKRYIGDVCAIPRTLVELRYITGNGVRLSKEPNPNSTILGLMYKGEAINYYTDMTGPAPYEYYVYIARSDDPKQGYVDKQYISRTKPNS